MSQGVGRSSGTLTDLNLRGRPRKHNRPNDYRCVYCHQYFGCYGDLHAHEGGCPLAAVVRQDWEHTIARAKRNEKHRALLQEPPVALI